MSNDRVRETDRQTDRDGDRQTERQGQRDTERNFGRYIGLFTEERKGEINRHIYIDRDGDRCKDRDRHDTHTVRSRDSYTAQTGGQIDRLERHLNNGRHKQKLIRSRQTDRQRDKDIQIHKPTDRYRETDASMCHEEGVTCCAVT